VLFLYRRYLRLTVICGSFHATLVCVHCTLLSVTCTRRVHERIDERRHVSTGYRPFITFSMFITLRCQSTRPQAELKGRHTDTLIHLFQRCVEYELTWDELTPKRVDWKPRTAGTIEYLCRLPYVNIAILYRIIRRQ